MAGVIELPVVVSSEPPRGVTGHFLVWLLHSATPVVMYRSALSTDWRRGAQRVTAYAYAGPIPEPKCGSTKGG